MNELPLHPTLMSTLQNLLLCILGVALLASGYLVAESPVSKIRKWVFAILSLLLAVMVKKWIDTFSPVLNIGADAAIMIVGIVILAFLVLKKK